MGNFFSTPNDGSVDHKEISDLKTRLADVERLDRNKDGLVTKDEFELWLGEQKKDIENFKKRVEASSDEKYQKILTQNERDLNDAKMQLKQLEVENEALKSVNQSLESRLQKNDDLNQAIRSLPMHLRDEKTRKLSSEISKKRIDSLVDELLADPDVNIKYFPDGIERQIYRNVFSIAINMLDSLVDTTSVNFMGHKLVFDLQPMLDNEMNRENKEEASESNESDSKKKKKKGRHGKIRA